MLRARHSGPLHDVEVARVEISDYLVGRTSIILWNEIVALIEHIPLFDVHRCWIYETIDVSVVFSWLELIALEQPLRYSDNVSLLDFFHVYVGSSSLIEAV